MMATTVLVHTFVIFAIKLILTVLLFNCKNFLKIFLNLNFLKANYGLVKLHIQVYYTGLFLKNFQFFGFIKILKKKITSKARHSRLIIHRACFAFRRIHFTNYLKVGSLGQVPYDDYYHVIKLSELPKSILFLVGSPSTLTQSAFVVCPVLLLLQYLKYSSRGYCFKQPES